MKYFRKYQFGSKGAATTKINQLSVDEEGNEVEHNHAIVRLGYIPIVKGTYDEEGNELTPPVLSDDYHVDVLWNGEPDEDWEDFTIWCEPLGVHVFGSSKAIAEWTEKCKELHPEYFPEPQEEE